MIKKTQTKKDTITMRAMPGELKKASQEFRGASRETRDIVQKLEKTITNLESCWQDASQQKFFGYYKEWHQHIQGFSQILDEIAAELDAVADRYANAGAVNPKTK
jgi:WXG100 family type VII secretion target